MEGKEKGFSLIELLVAITILGLLSALAAVNLFKVGVKAKQKKVVADVKVIEDAIVMFHEDVHRFPETLEELISPSGEGWDGPYLKKPEMIKDPWGRTYVYARTSGDPPYTIGSYGADGMAGGTGEDKDIFPTGGGQ